MVRRCAAYPRNWTTARGSYTRQSAITPLPRSFVLSMTKPPVSFTSASERGGSMRSQHRLLFLKVLRPRPASPAGLPDTLRAAEVDASVPQIFAPPSPSTFEAPYPVPDTPGGS
jgi:hypothetical protein